MFTGVQQTKRMPRNVFRVWYGWRFRDEDSEAMKKVEMC
jgi:hypothetical protein